MLLKQCWWCKNLHVVVTLFRWHDELRRIVSNNKLVPWSYILRLNFQRKPTIQHGCWCYRWLVNKKKNRDKNISANLKNLSTRSFSTNLKGRKCLISFDISDLLFRKIVSYHHKNQNMGLKVNLLEFVVFLQMNNFFKIKNN